MDRIGEAASRRFLLAGGASSLAIGLAGCSGIDLGGAGSPTAPAQIPETPATPTSGSTLGSGSVKIALILPLTSGSAGNVASHLRNAAEMALSEFPSPDLTIIVKDDAGTPEGAQNAARAALSEGAELVLGPLFAPSVQQVAAVARGQGKPVIAFSTDAGVASRGVYLLSFLPQNDVQRVVQFAVQSGKRSIGAFVPDNAYGQVVQGAFQEAVASAGARAIAIERFSLSAGGAATAAARLSSVASQMDAIFVPDPADGAAISALKGVGIDPARVQYLGAGPWEGNSAAASAAPTAVYAAPESAGYRAFVGRYRAKFGQDPVRIASLSYDATMLAAALAKTQGSARYTEGVLTNASGFNGVDGLFRFRPDGSNQRGLAVLRANGTVASPAPKSFGG